MLASLVGLASALHVPLADLQDQWLFAHAQVVGLLYIVDDDFDDDDGLPICRRPVLLPGLAAIPQEQRGLLVQVLVVCVLIVCNVALLERRQPQAGHTRRSDIGSQHTHRTHKPSDT